MKTSSFFKLMTLLMTVLAVSVSAEAKPLDDLCSYLNNQTAGLSKNVLELFEKDLTLKILRAQDCAQAKLVFRSGRLWVYRQMETQQYIMFLQGIRKNIVEASVSLKNHPEVRIQQYEVLTADNIRLPTILFQAVSIPQETPQTVILNRTPYLYMGLPSLKLAIEAAAEGKTLVLQPNRGTFTAPGQFEWLDWKQEREDARSTLDWISNQKWSNKKVLAVGHSYDGFSALAAATTFHPSLVGVFASSAPWNPQEDSLSAGGTYVNAAHFLNTLNSGGENARYNDNKLRLAIRKSPKFDSFVKSFANIANADFKSLPANLEYPDNRDFVAELKKAKATMVYTFGIQNDFDSRDVVNLFHELKGTPHHYFFRHNGGHYARPNELLYSALLTAQKDTTEELNEALEETTKGNPACAFLEDDSLKTICGPDWETLNRTAEQKLIYKEPTLGERSFVRFTARTFVFGTKTTKVRVTAPAFSEPRWLVAVATYCSAEMCGEVFDRAAVRLKAGTHIYNFKSQHLFQDVPANGGVMMQLGIMDVAGQTVQDPGVKIHRLEVTVPVIRAK